MGKDAPLIIENTIIVIALLIAPEAIEEIFGFKYGFLALSKNVLCALKLFTLNDPGDVAAPGSLGGLGFGFWT